MHGNGKFSEDVAGKATAGQAAAKGDGKAAASGEELISDDEFESLLDELHGSGKGPTAQAGHVPAGKAGQGDKAAGQSRQACCRPIRRQADSEACR